MSLDVDIELKKLLERVECSKSHDYPCASVLADVTYTLMRVIRNLKEKDEL